MMVVTQETKSRLKRRIKKEYIAKYDRKTGPTFDKSKAKSKQPVELETILSWKAPPKPL